MLNLNAIPLWAALTAEIFCWIGVCLRMFLILPSKRRWRVPIGVTVGAVLLQVTTGFQGASARTTAWMAQVVCGGLAGATVGRGRSYFRDYFELQDKYGERSPELRIFAMPFTITLLVVGAVLPTASAIFIKGITFK